MFCMTSIFFSAPYNFSPSHLQVMNTIRRMAPISRASLAQHTGLSSASVTNLTRDLIAHGLVQELGKLRGKKGQPAITLGLVAQAGYSVGISPTFEETVVVVTDFNGKLIGEERIATDELTAVEETKEIRQRAEVLLAREGAREADILAVGVALPTTFSKQHDPAGQPVLQLSENFAARKDEDYVAQLSKVFDRPAKLENDANAAASCEQLLGNSGNLTSFIYLFLGDGLGGSLILNGTLWQGAHRNAGEIGAMMPPPAPRPTWADLKMYLKEYGFEELTRTNFSEIAPLAEGPLKTWISRARTQLVELIYLSSSVLDPKGIVVGGTLPPELLERLAEGLPQAVAARFGQSRLQIPDITLSQHAGAAASAFGAAALGLN